MGKRQNSEIARPLIMGAVAVAVITLIFVFMRQDSFSNIRNQVNSTLEQISGRMERTGRLTLTDYEELSAVCTAANQVKSFDLSIEKKLASASELEASHQNSGMMSLCNMGHVYDSSLGECPFCAYDDSNRTDRLSGVLCLYTDEILELLHSKGSIMLTEGDAVTLMVAFTRSKSLFAEVAGIMNGIDADISVKSTIISDDLFEYQQCSSCGQWFRKGMGEYDISADYNRVHPGYELCLDCYRVRAE